MVLQNMQNQNMNLVLSTDAKPRLKWTPELHQRFVEAVNQLGGADSHTKEFDEDDGNSWTHFKYRLGKSQQSENCADIRQEDYKELQSSDGHFGADISDEDHSQINDVLANKPGFCCQVQRHLQLRIEAQGKYLQSVLKKAQETLSGYTSSSVGVELAKAELTQLVSMVNNGCPSSSFSELTETGTPTLKDVERKQMRGSMESSLTSSERSGREDEKLPENSNATCVELPLMDIHPHNKAWNNVANNHVFGRKRSSSPISEGVSVEQPVAKRTQTQRDKGGNNLRKSGLLATIDLNSKYQSDHIDSGPKAIDLNCKGI
ncbi:hypothetical protein C1H46_036185 [Malus baccata]|uniref:MYB-CC type transcription factor LHEQLE-containing domain-containing protein n=1 Tax=Malus baccata TaxID=106549 RepID=A0A540KVL0_MALBA|nr:hypothetical protein C1H46_036185 [Malus baccata]